jgi:ABC-type methionine transport system ATPase subunit
MTFPENLIKEPVVSRLIKETEVEVNIRRANVDEHVGWMICELVGDDGQIENSLAWLASAGVEVNRLGDVVES